MKEIFYHYGRNEIIKISELKLSITIFGRRLKIRGELKFYEAWENIESANFWELELV